MSVPAGTPGEQGARRWYVYRNPVPDGMWYCWMPDVEDRSLNRVSFSPKYSDDEIAAEMRNRGYEVVEVVPRLVSPASLEAVVETLADFALYRQERLAAASHALRPFRVLPNGEGRTYTGVTFPRDPRAGCDQIWRMLRAFGGLTDAADGYAVVDVLDADGDIIEDFGVTRDGFRWLKRKCNIAVESASGVSPSEPSRGER